MIPWMIVVTCLAGCEAGTPDLGANNFATKRDCDAAVERIATDWKPQTMPHGYVFTCRRWPW